eukprot:gb/GEZN01019412.1/.p1 GENE.gb/GEZN01019412.1/~~gb/GEZN01019412.1/.p1  ORF type:complete len:210 (+),score=39.46 gb/GEZN01019412.1/:79-630(+)
MATARLALAKLKIPQVVEFVELARAEHPVVVFGHHREVLEGIAAALGDKVVLMHGGTPVAQRQKMVDDFQSGFADVFIGSVGVASLGLTLTRASHVIFAELDWVPARLRQAEDRCHRIGQEAESVLIQHLVFEDSLDAHMVFTLIRKQQHIDLATEKESLEHLPLEGQPNAQKDSDSAWAFSK